MNRSSSLRIRLLAVFVGLGVFPILLVGVVLMAQIFQQKVETIKNSQRDQLARVAVEAEYFFRNLESQLLGVNRIQRLALLPVAEQRSALQILMADWHDFEEITLLNRDGREVLRLSDKELVTPGEARDLSTQDEFLVPRRTMATHAGRIRFEPDTGEPLMDLSVPFIAPATGEVEAVLVATIRVRRLWELTGGNVLSSGQVIYAVDEGQRVIAHPNPSVVLRQTIAPPDLVADKRPGLSGGTVFSSHRVLRIGQQEFIIVSEYSRDAAMAPTYLAMVSTVTVLLLTLGLSVGMVAYVHRTVIEPVERIAAVAKAIEGGESDARATVVRGDEIGHLALAFNAMTDRLFASSRELRNVLEHLSLYRDQTQVGHIEWDLDFRVVAWNPAAERIFGCPSADAMGRRGTELLFVEADRPEIESQWNGLLLLEGGNYLEQENTTRDGRVIVCAWHNTPIRDAEGCVVGVFSLIQDITERKRAEEAIVKLNEELEQRVRERTTALEQKNQQLEKMNKAFVGRELRMIELKARIEELEKKNGA